MERIRVASKRKTRGKRAPMNRMIWGGPPLLQKTHGGDKEHARSCQMAPECLIEIPVFFNSTVVADASQLQSSAADEQSALAGQKELSCTRHLGNPTPWPTCAALVPHSACSKILLHSAYLLLAFLWPWMGKTKELHSLEPCMNGIIQWSYRSRTCICICIYIYIFMYVIYIIYNNCNL